MRFADDFETTLDDWKPNMSDSGIMNLCVVSEGTYEVCSHTIAAKRRGNIILFVNFKVSARANFIFFTCRKCQMVP